MTGSRPCGPRSLGFFGAKSCAHPLRLACGLLLASVASAAAQSARVEIAYSLEQAAGDCGGASDEEPAIILVIDGMEACGADPLATMRGLMAGGINVKVHSIGFDVDAAHWRNWRASRRSTGGEYHDPRNAAALADSLRHLTQRALLIARDSAYGREIRGGST